MENQPHVFAGFWRRSFARVIDVALLSMVSIIVVVAFTYGLCVGSVGRPAKDTMEFAGYVAFGLLIVVNIALAFTFDFIYHATPGKLLLGIEVRDVHTGGIPSKKQHTLRFLASVLTMDVGFLCILFTRRKQGMHDLLSRTVVVRRS